MLKYTYRKNKRKLNARTRIHPQNRKRKVNHKKSYLIPFYRVYFILGNERYLYGAGFGDSCEEYSMLAKVDTERRKLIEIVVENMHNYIDEDLRLKNGKIFKGKKGETYSFIDTNSFKHQLINYIKTNS